MDVGRFLLRKIGPAAAACLVMGCAILYKPDEQCDFDSDCLRLARTVPALKGSFCQNHVCSWPPPIPAECEHNEDCMDAAHGDPAVCRDYQCVELRGAGCSWVLNADVLSTTDDVILLGAFEKLSTINSIQRGGLDSYELAASEMSLVNGVIGYTNQLARRPIVFVLCDNTPSAELDASFDHLTKKLRVPVAVTTLDSSVLVAQMSRLSSDSSVDTMYINAFSSDSTLDYSDGPRRVWSVLGNPLEDLGPAYVVLTKTQLAKITSQVPRVLLITTNFVEMLEIANLVESELGLASDSKYVYRRVDVDATKANTSAITSAIAEIAPDLVILLGGETLLQAAVWGNEARVVSEPTLESGPKYYVLSHHLANSPLLNEAMKGKSTGLYQRMLGVNFAGAKDSSLYDQYRARLLAKFPDAQVGFENYYDAAYYAMLSVAAAAPQRPTREITGTVAIQGFKRITDTVSGIDQFRLGGSLKNILYALETRDASISILGTLGPSDFSPLTGARHTDATVWCYRKTANVQGQFEWDAGKVRFDRASGAFDAAPDSCWQAQE